MTLTEAQREYLRVLGHSLQPVVEVGAGGLTHSIAKAVERALDDQGLVKVRVRFGDREKRSRVLAQLAPLADVCLVQEPCHCALLYRPSPRASIRLPPN